MQWLFLCAATRPFLSVQHLPKRYCEHLGSVDSRNVRFLGFRFSLGERYVIRVLWDVTSSSLKVGQPSVLDVNAAFNFRVGGNP